MNNNNNDIMREAELNSERKYSRKDAVWRLLKTIPTEGAREGTRETPARVAKMYDEIFAGYEMDPKEILSKTFATEVDCGAGSDIFQNGIVAVKEIPFYSSCEHHMVPFFGKAYIAYIPKDRVVGLSKLARLTDCFAKRLQIQERMTNQIANALVESLDPQGVMVVLQAEHLCMSMRGIRKPGTLTTTSAVRGVFAEKKEARDECLAIFGFGR